MALFGESSSRREPRSLVEFRAGKMKVNGTTVTADSRKGLVYIKMDDNLVHFCWKDRKSGRVEDDFIIFPGDAEVKTVSQCTTGRVVLLKFKDTNRKCFYWLQEPKEDKDEEYLKKVNDIITNPPTGGGDGGGTHQRFPGIMASQLQSLLQSGEVSQQQLMELLASGALGSPSILSGGGGGGGGVGPALESLLGGGRGSEPRSERDSHRSNTTTPSSRPQSTRRTEQTPRLQLSDLQRALASVQGLPTEGDGGVTSGQSAEQQQQSDDVSLRDMFTSEALRPLSHDPEFQQAVEPHLPPTNEDTETAVTTPQFQQAMGTFSSALSSGQLGPLMNEFGLQVDVANAAATGSTTRFAEALEKELKDEKGLEDKEGDNVKKDKE